MGKGKGITIIGRAERINFPELKLNGIAARIDTGAKTSSIWATNIHELEGMIQFKLFGVKSLHYSGQTIRTKQYEKRMVASSNGATEERYVIKLLIEVSGRKVRASFTLANRSKQTYPVLVGRNILRGRFLVDVKNGQPLLEEERLRSDELQNRLRRSEVS